VSNLLVLVMFFGPLLGVPVGLALMVRRGSTARRLGGGGAILAGAAWALLLWQYANCDEHGAGPCGAPDWLLILAAGAVVVGAVVVLAAGVAGLLSRASRSRPVR
jgi:hypothetical protein